MNCTATLEPGPADWITVNTDVAVNPQSRKAAAGGLIRDEFGHCLKAFTLNLGACSITRAEMRGAIAGLYFAWDLQFRHIELQMDSKEAIALFSDDDDVIHQNESEVWNFVSSIVGTGSFQFGISTEKAIMLRIT
ncbi:Putative ribonuclease H protein At1g65750 [Linum perenne]